MFTKGEICTNKYYTKLETTKFLPVLKLGSTGYFLLLQQFNIYHDKKLYDYYLDRNSKAKDW